jgi:hypothetical protein
MIFIRCHLGIILCSTEGVTVDGSKTAPNATRWIFDVEQPCKTATFELALLDHRTKKPKPFGLPAPHITPLNELAAEARIFCHSEKLRITSMPLDEEGTGTLLYRVTVDAPHSLMR